jgi:hypothetical protein
MKREFFAGMVNSFVPGNVAQLGASEREILKRRDTVLGPAYRLFYEEPIHIVRGEGVWLFDSEGKRYLDVYNNVASVGHCHPRVVAAICEQAAVLNTHTRYLHETIVEYAERLLATFPNELANVMFTCTGSESNDLAIRIAKAYTGAEGIIVTSLAYHGITDAVSKLSPSLGPNVPRGTFVRTVAAPDLYRSKTGDVGAEFASLVRDAMRTCVARVCGSRLLSATLSSLAMESWPILRASCAEPSKPFVLREGSSLPTKFRPASHGPERQCGDSSGMGSSPISSPWASRWGTDIRSRVWS